MANVLSKTPASTPQRRRGFWEMRTNRAEKSPYVIVKGKVYETVRVHMISLDRGQLRTDESINDSTEDQREAIDPFDQEQRFLEESAGDYLLSRLTKRQRVYAQLLIEGYTWGEIRERLGVSPITLKRIVKRIRLRLRACGIYSLTDTIPLEDMTRELVLLLVDLRPDLTAEVIWEGWEHDPVLCGYRRLRRDTLARWIKQV